MLFVACGKKAVVETELVKSHMIIVEDISDTTNILNYMNGIPYTTYYDEIRVSDNRLLRFYGIPFKTLEIAHTDGRIKRLSVELFKDSEAEDVKKVKGALSAKFGEPEKSEYNEKTFKWDSEKFLYLLEVTEEGYSNSSKLSIRLKGDSYYY